MTRLSCGFGIQLGDTGAVVDGAHSKRGRFDTGFDPMTKLPTYGQEAEAAC